MTRDEAIIFLGDISWGMGSMAMESWDDKTGAKVREAIEALGTETCTITTYIDGKEAKSQGIYLMQWIPVSERLPETNDDVLVYDGVDMYVAWYAWEGMWQGWNSHDNSFERDTPIIAWMPLPEPYRAEGSDKK